MVRCAFHIHADYACMGIAEFAFFVKKIYFIKRG